LSVSTTSLEINGISFVIRPSSGSFEAGEISFGTYIDGTEVSSPAVDILGDDMLVLGTAGIDFYFREEAIPVELTESSTGEDLLQQGLIIDFHPIFSTQVLGYDRAIGVSDDDCRARAGCRPLPDLRPRIRIGAMITLISH
jgi:hypothetical protein